MAVHVLVVDDDPAERRHIEEILRSQGHTVEGVASGEAALRRLLKADPIPVSAMILDLVMPERWRCFRSWGGARAPCR
jgi:CheY-like chemotaxis protein